MGAELERIAIFKSGIHSGNYLFHYCFLVVMLVHQVVANVLFLFFAELPSRAFIDHMILSTMFIKRVRPNASSHILQLKTKDI
jgi:hypothetical protein